MDSIFNIMIIEEQNFSSKADLIENGIKNNDDNNNQDHEQEKEIEGTGKMLKNIFFLN